MVQNYWGGALTGMYVDRLMERQAQFRYFEAIMLLEKIKIG